jgi:hypothetical protein
MVFSRRDVGRMAASVLPALWVRSGSAQTGPAARRFGGVELALGVPVGPGPLLPRPELLAERLGLTAVELRGEAIEAALGALERPAPRPTPPASATPAPTGAAPATPPRPPTPAQIAAQARAALRTWRLAATPAMFEAVRAQFAKAGVAIPIVRMPLGDGLYDEEIDYSFNVARWLGARALTCDAPVSQARRLGLFAEKHRMRVGFCGGSDVTNVDAFGRPGAWEQAFFYSPQNSACVDVGHYTAGNGTSAVEFLRRYHARITNICLSDRKTGQGPSVPWGEGNTPLREILQLVQRERYPWTVTIAVSYPLPSGSTVEAELARCVSFCEAALGGPFR